MIKSGLFYGISFLAVLSAFYSCAFEVAPRGGQKDLVAPKMLDSYPKDSALNVRTKEFKFTFDEFIGSVKPKDNIIFSPPVKDRGSVFVQGKRLFVQIEEPLKDNRTYQIILNGAVKDVNESNVLKSQSIRFSTDSVLDTCIISGQLINYRDNKPVKDVKILAYLNGTDSSLITGFPDYLSVTDENGYFLFNNLKPGSYTLAALKDINYSYTFDIPKEGIGFTTLPVLVDSSVMDSVDLVYFTEASSVRFLKDKKRPFGGKHFAYNAAIDSLRIRSLGNGLNWIYEFETGSDTFNIFQEGASLDTNWYEVRVNGEELVDTVFTYFAPLDSSDEKSIRSYASLLTSKVYGIKPIILFDRPVEIKFSNMLDSIVWDSIKVWQFDSLIYPKFSLDSVSRKKITIDHNWDENAPFRIFVRDSVFWDWRGKTMDTIAVKAKTRLKKVYGALNVKVIDTLQRNFIMRLSKGKDLLEEYYLRGDSTRIEKPYMQPGQYKVRFIHDVNIDNKWTTGDYSQRRQPERFYDYPIPLQIKGGFDIEQIIDLSEIDF